MYQFNDHITLEKSRADFLSKVLLLTALGLLVTFLTANFVNPMIYALGGFETIFYAAIITELVVVMVLSSLINKLSPVLAYILFFFYSILNGVTIGTLLIAYSSQTALMAFVAAGVTFALAGFFGYFTKVDLSPLRKFFLVGLIGIIAVGILGFFFNFSSIDFGVSIFAILLFIGITAYDMQKIKLIHNNVYSIDRERVSKYAILGALALYLDFINLFIRFLRIFGKRK